MRSNLISKLMVVGAFAILQVTMIAGLTAQPAAGDDFPMEGLKCGVSGGGRSCPQKNNTSFNYYCSVTTPGKTCGGPALPTDTCMFMTEGCGSKVSVANDQVIVDGEGLAVDCVQTRQNCA